MVVIAIIAILSGLLLPNLFDMREKARRVNCLSNQNGIWKTISAWGLDSGNSFRPIFPKGNLGGTNGSLTTEGGITPKMFICPTAAGDYGIKPAGTLAEITDSNSCYNYFASRYADDGDKVIICDMNGPNSQAGIGTNWGGNHRKGMIPQGGNIVKVAGQGMWVDSINVGDSTVSITNAVIVSAFDSTTIYLADINPPPAPEVGSTATPDVQNCGCGEHGGTGPILHNPGEPLPNDKKKK